MTRQSNALDRLRRIVGIGVEEEVESELDFHLQMRIHDLRAAGLGPTAARERAEREFGELRIDRAGVQNNREQEEPHDAPQRVDR